MSAPDRDAVLAALKTVIDPELGVNIVDLGLIYDLHLEEGRVSVTFTLTSPGCPLQYAMAAGIRGSVTALPGVEDCEVYLVWDPPWHPRMISEEGRAALGGSPAGGPSPPGEIDLLSDDRL